MLIYDDTFVAAMKATQDEATALGARTYGSEHVLLGLLASDDDLTRRVARGCPALTADGVREAVRRSLDDAPHLARVGVDIAEAMPEPDSARPLRRTAPRNKHAPELQTALNAASAKWGHLRNTQAVPRERKVSSAVLWLAVLEPSSRASRLLAAMGVDPDTLRATVLTTIARDGASTPEWPVDPPLGRVARLSQWVLARAAVDGDRRRLPHLVPAASGQPAHASPGRSTALAASDELASDRLRHGHDQLLLP